jgi:hypothetical protein
MCWLRHGSASCSDGLRTGRSKDIQRRQLVVVNNSCWQSLPFVAFPTAMHTVFIFVRVIIVVSHATCGRGATMRNLHVLLLVPLLVKPALFQINHGLTDQTARHI